MTETHPCHGCTKARYLMVTPTATKRAPVCKIYRGVIVAKCADYVKFAKKAQEEN